METLEELKAKQRANQRQELLAIAYGNAPDKMRQEALKLLQEMDVQEELQTALKIVRKELDQAAARAVEDTPPHFSSGYTEEKATAIFNTLLECECIAQDSNLQDFLYYCGVQEQTPAQKPIVWTETQTLLGYFIQKEIGDNNKWQIAQRVFVRKDGKPINKNTIKVEISRGWNKKSADKWSNIADRIA